MSKARSSSFDPPAIFFQHNRYRLTLIKITKLIATKKIDTNILPLDWPVAEKEIVSYSHANGTTCMIKSENCWNERKIANAGCVDKLYVSLRHEGRYAEQVLQPLFCEKWNKIEKGLTV